jgi:predicted esterase
MLSIKNIEVKRTARYATWGKMNENITDVWFVLHGYGQLSEYFIKKFQFLDTSTHFVIAPEALSRHYLDNFSGKVGAVWMTKEDRENEINDYIFYLQHLQQTLLQDFPKKYKIHILAFSQGCATALRWVNTCSTRADNLILWAGDFPMEIDYSIWKQKMPHLSLFYVYGLQDNWLGLPEKAQEFKERVEKMNFLVKKIITFEGKHEIHQEALKMIVETELK